MLRREICSLKENGQGKHGLEAVQIGDIEKADFQVGPSAAEADDVRLSRGSGGGCSRGFVTKSEVQEMIYESQKFHILQITGVLREMMADVLKKRDLDTLAVELRRGSSVGLADLVSRITDLEAWAADDKLRTKELQDSMLADMISAMRESLAEVPKSGDLVQHMADLNNQVSESLKFISIRVGTLETGAAARKEGLRRRIDEIDSKGRELEQHLAALEVELDCGLQGRVEAAFVRVFAAHDREMKAKARRKGRSDRTAPFDMRSKQGRASRGPLKTEQKNKTNFDYPNTYREHDKVAAGQALNHRARVVSSMGLWGQVFGVGLLTPAEARSACRGAPRATSENNRE